MDRQNEISKLTMQGDYLRMGGARESEGSASPHLGALNVTFLLFKTQHSQRFWCDFVINEVFVFSRWQRV